MDKYDISKPVTLKTGVYKLNPERNFDYQLNRVINWDARCNTPSIQRNGVNTSFP